MARKQQRNIGDEILKGLQAVKAHYEGKVTLRSDTVGFSACGRPRDGGRHPQQGRPAPCHALRR